MGPRVRSDDVEEVGEGGEVEGAEEVEEEGEVGWESLGRREVR